MSKLLGVTLVLLTLACIWSDSPVSAARWSKTARKACLCMCKGDNHLKEICKPHFAKDLMESGQLRKCSCSKMKKPKVKDKNGVPPVHYPDEFSRPF